MDLLRRLLSTKLRQLREGKNLSNKFVASQIEVAATTYGQWEAGIAWPNSANIERLAEFYNVRASLFFHDPDLDVSSTERTVSFDDKLALLDPLTREHIESLVNGLLVGK